MAEAEARLKDKQQKYKPKQNPGQRLKYKQLTSEHREKWGVSTLFPMHQSTTLTKRYNIFKLPYNVGENKDQSQQPRHL